MNGMIGNMQQDQQEPQQQPQQGGTYPQSKEEVAQFVNDIMRMIYSEGQPEKILDRLAAGDDIAKALGETAGMLVMTTLMRREQETGRKPHFNLLIRGLKKALDEMTDLMEMAGMKKPPPEIMQDAAKYAGQIVESSVKGKGQGQQAQGQEPMQEQPPQQGAM